MRLVLHVGLPKTGSTHLQAQIFRHRDALARLGVAVLETATNGFRKPPYNLARELLGDPRFDPAAGSWSDLEDELRGVEAPIALVSCEGFASCLDAERLERLAKLSARTGRALTILAVLREPIAWLNSTYQQDVRDLVVADRFEPYCEMRRAEGFLDHGARFAPVLAHPELTLEARSFDRFRASEPLVALAGMLGLDPAPLAGLPEVEGRENVSVGARSVALARFLARALPELAPGFSNAHPQYRALRRGFRERCEAAGWNREPYWGWTPEAIDRLQATLVPALDAFSERLWGEPWPDRSPTGRSANDVALHDFDAGDAARAVEILSELHALVAQPHASAEPVPTEPKRGAWAATRDWIRRRLGATR